VPVIFPGGKGGRCVVLTTLPPTCAECLEIWEINRIMEKTYQKLNKKLDTLTHQKEKDHDFKQNQKNPKHQQRIINMTDIQLTKEQFQTLALVPKYAIEQEPNLYKNELIVDTENAISVSSFLLSFWYVFSIILFICKSILYCTCCHYHYHSNHPYEHKITAFIYYINRMLTLPITEKAEKEEWKTIVSTATNNGYPKQTIYKLRDKIKHKKQQEQKQNLTTEHKKWTTFTYFSPLIRKVTNLFKDTKLNIAFKTTNTIQQ